MKAEVLRQLKASDGFVSGQELCETFRVSRTAVWKAIQQLKEEGYAIEAVQNKGYRLTDCNDLLSREELETSITGTLGKPVTYVAGVDSTNNLAKKLAENGAPHGSLVAADCQDAGRGRRGRGWVSPAGTGIWMSLVLRPDLPPSKASMITLVAALAVREGIFCSTGLPTLIKWPNDIVASGKKICGILTEMSAELEAIHYIVTGIGINCNMELFSGDMKAIATSIRIETGKMARRSKVVASLLESFERFYDSFLKYGDLTELVEIYNGWLANYEKEVRVLDPAGDYTGTAKGINAGGELLVERPDGTVTCVGSGEVSVRGLYGYV